MQCKRGENQETIRKMMSSQLASKLARVWLPGSAQANRTFLLKLFVRRVPLCRMIFHTVESASFFFVLPLCLRFHCLRAKLASFGLLSTDLLVCFIWPDAAAALSVARVQGKRSQSTDSEGLADPPGLGRTGRSTKSRGDARKATSALASCLDLAGRIDDL